MLPYDCKHESSRLTMVCESLILGFENNFEKRTEAFVTTQGIEYDFGSVMHYRANAFAIDRSQATVFPLPGFGLSPSDLGQRDGFSEADIVHVLQLYCPSDQAVTYG